MSDNEPQLVDDGHAAEWRLNGMYHKIGEPAVTYRDGSESWYEEGDRHRVGGPAIIWPNTSRGPMLQYWLDGTCYTLDGYCKKLNLPDEDKSFLVLMFGYGDTKVLQNR